MSKHYRYYLGRITKGGTLKTEDIVKAILNPTIITKNLYNYTFTNMYYDEQQNYVYGNLVKFTTESEVETIIPDQHKETSVYIEHKKESSSPFIVVLDYMGIVYPHIWNNLLKEQFEKYFCELITYKYDNFFVSCEIEPIVDLRTFVDRISSLSRIDNISATVVPPNPLFGPVWKELKEYMENRESSELTITEKSKQVEGIRSKIKHLITYFIEKDSKESIKPIVDEKYDITDAATLMAADGYGRAKIEGLIDKKRVIIKTKDNQKSFLYDRDPIIEEFYEYVSAEFENINTERYLGH